MQGILLLLEFLALVVDVRDYFLDFCVDAFIPIVSAEDCVCDIRIEGQQVLEFNLIVDNSDGLSEVVRVDVVATLSFEDGKWKVSVLLEWIEYYSDDVTILCLQPLEV